MKKDSASKNHAYTLIELLVGISIISIIFSVGFASYRDFSRRQALTGVTKAIVTDLRLIQQKSLSGEKPDTCTLSGYQMKRTSATAYELQAICSPNVVVTVKTVDLVEDGVTISFSAGADPIMFKVLGQGTNLTAVATITVTNTNMNKSSHVYVGIGGDVYTE